MIPSAAHTDPMQTRNAFQRTGQPQNYPFPWEDLDRDLIAGSLDPRESDPPQRQVDRFSRFCTAHLSDRHTDIQTTLRATSVAIGRICTMHKIRAATGLIADCINKTIYRSWTVDCPRVEDLFWQSDCLVALTLSFGLTLELRRSPSLCLYATTETTRSSIGPTLDVRLNKLCTDQCRNGPTEPTGPVSFGLALPSRFFVTFVSFCSRWNVATLWVVNPDVSCRQHQTGQYFSWLTHRY